MSEAMYLLLVLAGQNVALPADTVESVVEIDAVTPVPLVAPHVAGLFALRSRVLTVIDTRASLALPPTDGRSEQEAVIVAHDGHPYALLVDHVDDVVHAGSPEPVRALLQGRWKDASLGTVVCDGQARLLLDPAVLIAGPPASAAAA